MDLCEFEVPDQPGLRRPCLKKKKNSFEKYFRFHFLFLLYSFFVLFLFFVTVSVLMGGMGACILPFTVY